MKPQLAAPAWSPLIGDDALLEAYAQLQVIINALYIAHAKVATNDDDEDASLLVSRADRLYEEAENLNLIISELEEK